MVRVTNDDPVMLVRLLSKCCLHLREYQVKYLRNGLKLVRLARFDCYFLGSEGFLASPIFII